MKDDEILSSMVKGRECCRQLVQAYESVHSRTNEADVVSATDISLLTTADRVVSRMLSCFQDIPASPNSSLQTDSNRAYATRLLVEITELLEKAMILEREVRNTEETGSERKRRGTPGISALKAYAGG